MQKLISTVIRLFPVFILSSCLLLPHQVTLGGPLARITVDAGDYTRLDTPVSLDLSGVPFGFPNERPSLVEIKGNRRVPV